MKLLDIPEEWKTLGLALDQFNALEHEIAKVIAQFVGASPARTGFVEDVVLHNAVVSFGSKVKLLLTVARESKGPKPTKDKLHRLLNIRNAFAHGHMIKGLRVNINALRAEPYGPYLIVETLKGDGTVEEKARSEVMAEFLALLQEVGTEVEALALHLKDVETNGPS
jgi:hypothetical protein